MQKKYHLVNFLDDFRKKSTSNQPGVDILSDLRISK